MLEVLLKLAYEFAKTGLFAVGGGLATLPFLYDIGQKTGWYETKDVTDMIAISQSTPGPMGINMATYVGFQVAGLLGVIIAPIALVFPSVVVIIAISRALTKFKESPVVGNIFYGLRPASSALIVVAGLGVAKLTLLNLDKYKLSSNLKDLINYKSILLALFILFIYKKLKLHPILMILISAIIGIIFKF